MKLLWNMLMLFLAFVFLSCEKDQRLNADQDTSSKDTTSFSQNNDSTSSENEQMAAIKVTVTNFKSTKGQLLLGLYNKAEDFPEKDRTYEARVVEVESKEVNVQIDSVEPDTYALSVHHDKNNNKEIDQNALGIPQEGFGFSNNASGTFGPPKFDNAKFQVEKGKTKMLNIKLTHY